MLTRSKTISFTLAFILLLGGAVFLSKDLGSGENVGYDSLYTLERSHGFQKHHDWFNVYWISCTISSQMSEVTDYLMSLVIIIEKDYV